MAAFLDQWHSPVVVKKNILPQSLQYLLSDILENIFQVLFKGSGVKVREKAGITIIEFK